MPVKASRRIRNWAKYNQSLITRGSLTFWFNKQAITSWQGSPNGKRGRPQKFSDDSILTALMLKAIYRLRLRGIQGFLQSIVEMLRLPLEVPNYSTLCRRASRIKVPLSAANSNEPLHIVFDSTGLKIYGEGEWLVRQHGISKRRVWRKVHLGICAKTQQIIVGAIGSHKGGDAQALPTLLKGVSNIATVTADGAYDTRGCYEAIYLRGAKPIIPPRQGAKRSSHPALVHRNEAIDRIYRQRRGRKRWKEEVGYHRRSLVETAMSRLKGCVGEKLYSRRWKTQATELFIGLRVLNKMAALGLPERELLAA